VASGPDGQQLTYAELVAGFSLHVAAKPDVPRRAKGRRLIGDDLPRVRHPRQR